MKEKRHKMAEGDSVLQNETDDPASTERTTEGEASASLEGDHDRGCPKCGHRETVTDEISTTGSGLSKFFDIQNRRFAAVSCENCGHSELYRGQSSGDIVDIPLG
jgi:predicted nucleic-acid-binding Zn-ribbon protein